MEIFNIDSGWLVEVPEEEMRAAIDLVRVAARCPAAWLTWLTYVPSIPQPCHFRVLGTIRPCPPSALPASYFRTKGTALPWPRRAGSGRG